MHTLWMDTNSCDFALSLHLLLKIIYFFIDILMHTLGKMIFFNKKVNLIHKSSQEKILKNILNIQLDDFPQQKLSS